MIGLIRNIKICVYFIHNIFNSHDSEYLVVVYLGFMHVRVYTKLLTLLATVQITHNLNGTHVNMHVCHIRMQKQKYAWHQTMRVHAYE